MQQCERCNASLEGFDLTDYCAHCSKNLCHACMEKGCCGHTPAESGMAADYDEDDEQDYTDPENIYGLASIRQSIEEDRKRRW